MELSLFKRTEEDGTISRYSLLVACEFNRFGQKLEPLEGAWQGNLSPEGDKFVIQVGTTTDHSAAEVPADVVHTRTQLRTIEGLSLSNPPVEIEFQVSEPQNSSTSTKGSVVIADAEEEEAKPKTIHLGPADD